jgi:DNA-binding response OmpR family regulator
LEVTVTYRILIVDDEPRIRDLYRLELEEAGFDVETAADSRQALFLAQHWSPDLVALDIQLGAENGLDLLRQIVDTRGSIPTILISSYPAYKDDFRSWLADAFLIKSGDITEFRDTIIEVLSTPPGPDLSPGTPRTPVSATPGGRPPSARTRPSSREGVIGTQRARPVGLDSAPCARTHSWNPGSSRRSRSG